MYSWRNTNMTGKEFLSLSAVEVRDWIEKQKETLYHELMHCYIIAYLYDGMQFDEEALCNISAKSHDMIHEIVKQYFNKSR